MRGGGEKETDGEKNIDESKWKRTSHLKIACGV